MGAIDYRFEHLEPQRTQAMKAEMNTATRVGIKLLLLLSISIMLSGCASGYQKFFRSSMAEPHPPISEYYRYNVNAFVGEPKIYYQTLDEDGRLRLIENGLVLLGYASFNGPPEGHDALVNEAKRIGAEVVFASSQYSHTVSGAVPVTTYSPQTFQSSGTVTTSSGNWASYSGTTTGTTSQTSYMPYSVARYDQHASFWTRSIRPRILGAVAVELNAEDRRTVGANQGVKVVVCVRDSPAWLANVLAGDFILAINGTPVTGLADFAGRLDSLAGSTVVLQLLRGTNRMEMSVQLNQNPLQTKPS